MLRGHCQCGAIHYEADAPPSHETACHCTICRRVSGAPFVAWFTVPSASLRFTRGTPASFASSEHGVRQFCPGCGTPLSFQSSRSPGEIDLTTCSLDDPEQVPPRDHTYARSKLSWVQLADALPRHATTRCG